MAGKTKKLSNEQRYQLYEEAVQNPQGDIEFILKQFQKTHAFEPVSLREDFAGTAFLSCEWVRESAKRKSYAIDLDPAPLEYGHRQHWLKLSDDQKKRAQFIKGNVLELRDFKTDVIVAFNFSYYIFKERQQLLEYFSKVRMGLNQKGMFFLDLFGGTQAFQTLEERTRKKGSTYVWDCSEFNVIDYHCKYYIHFVIGNERFEKAFEYNWRMWTLPELKDLLLEAGFSKVVCYWEGDDGKGGGDGVFKPQSKAENCYSWIAYLGAIP